MSDMTSLGYKQGNESVYSIHMLGSFWDGIFSSWMCILEYFKGNSSSSSFILKTFISFTTYP